MVQRFGPLVLALQFVIDMFLTLAAVAGAVQLRLHLVTGLEQREGFTEFVAIQPSVYVLICVIWVCFLCLFGAFDARRRDSLLVDLGRLWLSITVSMLVLASTFYFLALQPPLAPSRLFYAYFYLLDLGLLTAAHIAAFQLVAFLRRRGKHLRRALLVGAGVRGRHVAVRLQGHEATGLVRVGYVSPPSEPPVPGLPRTGDFGDVARLVRDQKIEEVVIALPAAQHAEVLRMNVELQNTDVQLRILPDVFEMVAMRARIDDFYGLPLISLREPSMNPIQAGMKRLFDVVVAGFLLILLVPLMAAIAIWIRVDSRGPILIHQRRVGVGGAIFHMHKFRSMRWNPAELDAVVPKGPHDSRVTRAGRLLRRTSLDELPQLWNVIMGEMSLVGPRPELPAIVDLYEPWQLKRFSVPPGMTGWWQINGRSDRSMHQNTEIDLFYVQNYSILLDVQILLRTLGAVIRGKGAY